MIWNEARECMSRDEMANMQGARLRKLVANVYHNVEFYRKKMQAMGLEPGDIKGIEDITLRIEPSEHLSHRHKAGRIRHGGI